MATRDQRPYAERTDATASGVELYALHNLTTEDIAQLTAAIRSRRVLQELRLQDKPAPPPLVARKLRMDAARLDLITTTLEITVYHAPGTVTKRAS